MSHDVQLGVNKKCHRFLFPLGMPQLWALFQDGLVFENIHYKPNILSSLFLLHCLHQPPLAVVLSLPQLEHWSLTSVSLCGLEASHVHSRSAFPLAFNSFFPLVQSAAVGSPRGWEIPTASS